MTDDAVLVAPMSGLLMPHEGYIGAAVTLFFIGFVGFFSNLIVIVIMCREKQVRKAIFVTLYIYTFSINKEIKTMDGFTFGYECL